MTTTARTRELASSSQDLPQTDQLASSDARTFEEVIRLVELADGGRPLYGDGRVECEAAHASHPIGFALAVAEALDGDSARSRRRVLVSLIRKGWHVQAEDLASRGAEVPPRPATKYGRRAVTGAEMRARAEQLRRDEESDASL